MNVKQSARAIELLEAGIKQKVGEVLKNTHFYTYFKGMLKIICHTCHNMYINIH